ncbi:hypothetical protein [Helicobacter aurati]|uniref:hypothetical protein n=1 Tax=Helicobacter aurati TaxID=137778 RepID=UPI001315AD7F|nr:hypothetical protein [Helicobacter aurati]
MEFVARTKVDNIIYQPFIIAESELSTQTTITNRYTNTNDDALQRASQNSYDSKCYPPPPPYCCQTWYRILRPFYRLLVQSRRAIFKLYYQPPKI